MGRLIDVDKFKADCGMADDCEDCKQNASLCQYDIIYSKMDFCGWLDDAPTVDAVPVRKGQWRHYEGVLTCSECGTEYYDDIIEWCGDHVPKFCPDCGADMRKDGDQ